MPGCAGHPGLYLRSKSNGEQTPKCNNLSSAPRWCRRSSGKTARGRTTRTVETRVCIAVGASLRSEKNGKGYIWSLGLLDGVTVVRAPG